MKKNGTKGHFGLIALPHILFFVGITIFLICAVPYFKTSGDLFFSIILAVAIIAASPYSFVALIGFFSGVGVLMLPFTFLEPEGVIMFALWIISIAGVLSMFGIRRVQVGKIPEDESCEVGSHPEISFDSSGKGTIKEVTDYAGDTHTFRNGFMCFFRCISILTAGVILYARYRKPYCNSKRL